MVPKLCIAAPVPHELMGVLQDVLSILFFLGLPGTVRSWILCDSYAIEDGGAWVSWEEEDTVTTISLGTAAVHGTCKITA